MFTTEQILLHKMWNVFLRKKGQSQIRKFVLFHLPFLTIILNMMNNLFGFIDLVIIEFNKNKAKISLPWHDFKNMQNNFATTKLCGL